MKRAVILARTILCLAAMCLAAMCLTAMCLTAGAALAQTSDKYPSRPVKIIVPYAPGGATDIVARILADQMSKRLGQSFYVESKPGAFGIIAIEDMVRSPADGYTLMIGNVSTNAITPIIYAEEIQDRLLKGRGADHQCGRHTGFPPRHDEGFQCR